MLHWIVQVLIALDQLVNALTGGWADETLSSRAWRTERKGRIGGIIMRPIIDLLASPFEDSHCHKSFNAERYGFQLPPEAR